MSYESDIGSLLEINNNTIKELLIELDAFMCLFLVLNVSSIIFTSYFSLVNQEMINQYFCILHITEKGYYYSLRYMAVLVNYPYLKKNLDKSNSIVIIIKSD